jgi:hypothetical protein
VCLAKAPERHDTRSWVLDLDRHLGPRRPRSAQHRRFHCHRLSGRSASGTPGAGEERRRLRNRLRDHDDIDRCVAGQRREGRR